MTPLGDLEIKTQRRVIALFRDRLPDEHLGDWKNPPANHSGIAEDVMVGGAHTNRPDLVHCVHAIAVGLIDLNRRPCRWERASAELASPERYYMRCFFTTAQPVMAGNHSYGPRHGTIGTPEEYWLRRKESGGCNAASPLLREVGRLCMPNRPLELIHDGVAFEAGAKKVCRHKQYFGVRVSNLTSLTSSVADAGSSVTRKVGAQVSDRVACEMDP